VDIGLSGDGDKALRLADMLLHSWEGGLDVCVDLTGSSPLTQTGMVDFVPGRAVIDVAQRKRDAVTLLKRIRKFSMAQDIGARAAVHIFNRISFSIAKAYPRLSNSWALEVALHNAMEKKKRKYASICEDNGINSARRGVAA
nr:hypothetical protein [Tanacetum cinerariifolium]